MSLCAEVLLAEEKMRGPADGCEDGCLGGGRRLGGRPYMCGWWSWRVETALRSGRKGMRANRQRVQRHMGGDSDSLKPVANLDFVRRYAV